MSFQTGTNTELLYCNDNPGSAKNTFTSEVSINDATGMGPPPLLPVGFFNRSRLGLKIIARGILSSTVTPTYTFTVRGGAAGATSGAVLLGTAALTTQSTISNKGWELEADVIFGDPAGAAATHGTGAGMLSCPAGLASPFQYEVWGGSAQPGTFTTFDPSIANYINFNVACSASSSSNSITLIQLLIFGLN